MKGFYIPCVRALLFPTVLGACGVMSATAEVVLEQAGARDPEADGRWEARQSGGVSGAPAPDGEAAWRLSDPGRGTLAYRALIPADRMEMAREKGWRLGVEMRIPAEDASNVAWSPIATVTLVDAESGKAWSIRLRLGPTGCLLVSSGGRHAEVKQTLATDFHRSELVFDPGTGTATLTVDGEEVFTGIEGGPAESEGETSVTWGAMADRPSSTTDYRLVRFEILP